VRVAIKGLIMSIRFSDWQKKVDRCFRKIVADHRGQHWSQEERENFLADKDYSQFNFDYDSFFEELQSVEDTAYAMLEKLESEGWCT